VLPGDVDNTGAVTSYDVYFTNVLNGKMTTSAGYVALRDIDGSGIINSTDVQSVTARLAHTLPTGTPAGASDDAPTTAGLPRLQMDNMSADYTINLWSAFDDIESGAQGLTFSVQSNSAANLFDNVQINSSTGQLTLNGAANALGRARIVIRATDSAGLFVETVATIDVNRTNAAPVIYNVYTTPLGGGTYLITGNVSDADDDVKYFAIDFWGFYVTRSGVDENGSFEIALSAPGDEWEHLFMQTLDSHMLESNVVSQQIGFT
jgi:hypothetical protein